jgi:hypothetical protein
LSHASSSIPGTLLCAGASAEVLLLLPVADTWRAQRRRGARGARPAAPTGA